MAVGDLETERMDQVEPGSGQGAQAPDIPRVLGNFGIEKDEMQHDDSLGHGQKSCQPSVSRFTANGLQHTVEACPMSSPSAKTLVIVDDEKSYTDLLGELLAESLCCPIQTFNRPLAALEAMPKLNVGLIVTDYCMPQINGIEFIRRSQLIAPEASVIVITGHRMELEQTDYSDITSLRAILAKPLSWRVLADEIIKHWPAAQRPAPAVEPGR